jgi:tRNA A-37 threonylcarbamoyl transferase component Bud32
VPDASALPTFSEGFLATYEILEQLGKGGMGTVLKARHRRLDRLVTIKLVNLVDPEAQDRFLQEGQLLARVDHERVIRVFDSNKDNNVPYLVCEYVEGRTLRDVLDREAPLPIERKLDLAIQLMEGLGAAHELHVVHRDIKPDNVLITSDWRVKIADFGLARSTKTDLRRTSSGVMIGTPSYMSPEQITGDEISERTDLYAAGVLLFEMLCGRVPYEGRVALEVLNQHVSGAVPKLSLVKPELALPRALDAVIEFALAKAPANRFASAEAFRHELERIRDSLANAGTPSLPVPTPEPVRTRGDTLALARPGPPVSTARMQRPLERGARIRAALGLMAVGCLIVAAFLRPLKGRTESEDEAGRMIGRAAAMLRDGRAKDSEGRTVREIVDRAVKRWPHVDLSRVVDEYLRQSEDMRSAGHLLSALTHLDRVLQLRPNHPKANQSRQALASEMKQREGKVVVSVPGPPMRFVDDPARVLVYAGRTGYLLVYLVEPSGRRTRLIPPDTNLPHVTAPTERLWPPMGMPGEVLWEEAGDHLLYAIVLEEQPELKPAAVMAFKDQAAARSALEKWIGDVGKGVLAWHTVPFAVWPKKDRVAGSPAP